MSCENCQELNKCNNNKSFPKITSAFLILTNQCNLKCVYCFVNQNIKRMTYETALNSAKFLIKNAEDLKTTPMITFLAENL